MIRIGELNGNWKGGKKKCECIICHKIFYAYVGKQHQGKYCSRKCYQDNLKGENNPAYKNGNIIKQCLQCKDNFIVRVADANRNRGIFCSRKCRGIYIIAHSIKNKGTDIEIILEKWLKENNISYESQKIIDNVTVVDFFVKPDICIYADGDYWHSFTQNKDRDQKVNKYLIEAGYRVIRLLGSEIKNGVRPCLN